MGGIGGAAFSWQTSLLKSYSANLAAQVGRRQWERVLEMVRRIRALDMEVRTQSRHPHILTCKL